MTPTPCSSGLRLAASLDLSAATPLATELVGLRGRAVELDAGDVSRIGGQCLQVLLAARAAWAADGHGFAIVNPSPEFLEGLALMGASDLSSSEVI
jgi:chemotaxis protein CheX